MIQPITSQAPKIMELLRSSTRPQHESLDQRLGASLFSPTFGLEEYRLLLGKFYGLLAPFELSIPTLEQSAAWQEVGFSLTNRRRIPSITQDLLSLGLSEADIQSLPTTNSMMALVDSLPALWGALYVTEGSTLGGQFIAKHLEKTLHLTVESGVAFFRSYGPHEVKPMWRQFGEALSTYTTIHPESESIILQTAASSFTAFENWLFA